MGLNRVFLECLSSYSQYWSLPKQLFNWGNHHNKYPYNFIFKIIVAFFSAKISCHNHNQAGQGALISLPKIHL